MDDDKGIRTYVETVCRRSNVRCIQARSASEVAAILAEQIPALVLLDLTLERSDAVQVLDHLSSVHFAGSVVLVSGHDQALLNGVFEIGRKKNLNMLRSLSKPLRVSDLKDLLLSTGLQAGSAQITAAEIRGAIADDRIEVWYQPCVHLDSLETRDVEAQVRLRGGAGIVSKLEDFADHLGADEMIALMQAVIQRAFLDWTRLARSGLILRMSLDLRIDELLNPAIADALIASKPDDPRWPGLVLETTEAQLSSRLPEAREAFLRLRLHKFGVALDQFGLSALDPADYRGLHLTEIKIDRSFVDGCSLYVRKQELCRAALKFAKALNVVPTAVGVESKDDLIVLRNLGFQNAQGPYFSQPLPIDELEAFILAQRRRSWSAVQKPVYSPLEPVPSGPRLVGAHVSTSA